MESNPTSNRVHTGFGLPLLVRELTESAARSTTYRRRVICAVLMYAFALMRLWVLVPSGASGVFSVLGIGKVFFSDLIWMTQVAICLFLPGLIAGSLTSEKEQGTLELLLLTRLSPGTIVLEKLGSAVVAMVSLLLPVLPLLALAYSLGGVTNQTLWSGVILMVVMCLQIGALGLACSAWLRKTPLAVTAAYGLTVVLLCGPPAILAGCADYFDLAGRNNWLKEAATLLYALGVLQTPEQALFPTFPAMAVFSPFSGGATVEIWRTLLLCIPSLLAAVGLLRLARRGLVAAPLTASAGDASAAVVQGACELPASRFAAFWNRYLSTPLPGDFPIYWRESRLSRVRQWKPLAVKLSLLAGTLGLLIYVISQSNPIDLSFSVSLVMLVLWAPLLLLIALQGATAFSGERNQQTLQLLCTTPLRGDQIVREKWWAIRRLICGTGVVLLTAALVNAWFRWPDAFADLRTRGLSAPMAQYLVCWCLTLGVTMPSLIWLGVWHGLSRKTQSGAVYSTLWKLLAWLTAPPVILATLFNLPIFLRTNLGLSKLLWLTSPGAVVAVNEFGSLSELGANPWIVLLLNTAAYGAIGYSLRRTCQTRADRCLDRLDSNSTKKSVDPLAATDRSNPTSERRDSPPVHSMDLPATQ